MNFERDVLQRRDGCLRIELQIAFEQRALERGKLGLPTQKTVALRDSLQPNGIVGAAHLNRLRESVAQPVEHEDAEGDGRARVDDHQQRIGSTGQMAEEYDVLISDDE